MLCCVRRCRESSVRLLGDGGHAAGRVEIGTRLNRMQCTIQVKLHFTNFGAVPLSC